MDWLIKVLDLGADWIRWVIENKAMISLPAALIGVLLGIRAAFGVFQRQLHTYRFLSNFFEDAVRANREWWAGRMWQWWGIIPPIDRARLRAELDILQPQHHRPRVSRLVWGAAKRKLLKDWRTDRAEWEKNARDIESKLARIRQTHDSRIKKMTAIEFEAEAPLCELETPAELDHEDRRKRIVKYFYVLENLPDARVHDFGSFLTFLKISDGYVAPAFLIAGLMTRFENDWARIIGNYRSVLDRSQVIGWAEKRYSRELEELRSFQFNCWLLWGPSIPLCTCEEWSPAGNAENAGPETIVMQYGFGDEACCVDFMIESATARRAYEDWFRSVERQTRPGEPRHVGAIPGALIGQIMWGPRISSKDLCNAQRSALVGSAGAVGRVALRFTKRLESGSLSNVDRSDAREGISNYYSAYVWIMFALVDVGGLPLHAEKEMAHRSLLPFFEHGNIADATTLQTIKENLVAKSLSALAEIVVRETDDNVRIAYCGACDHSGCGSPTRYPPSPPKPYPEDSYAEIRPPRIIDILRRERDNHRLFMRTQYASRLILPPDDVAATIGDGRFASCHLPTIVEDFMNQIGQFEAASSR